MTAAALIGAGVASTALGAPAVAAESPRPSTPTDQPTITRADLAHRGSVADQLRTRSEGDSTATPTPKAPRAASDATTTYLLKLDTSGTEVARKRAGGTGSAANRAASAQMGRVRDAQAQVISDLPAGTSVVYRTHAIMAGVAVRAKASKLAALEAIDGVAAVYPVAPKSPSVGTSIPLQGGPAAWSSVGTGAGQRIAIIDTGIDYTHADFGGAGTPAAFAAAKGITDASWITSKVVGGYDLVGDDYNADEAVHATPQPDANPLDCHGHGTHVAGIAAGQGVKKTGATYDGTYDAGTDFSQMRIGPGMAPQASLLAFRVFGCEGSTNVVAEALDRALDPDGNPATDDGADVINLSLGADFGSPRDGDSVAVNAAVSAGAVVTVSSGNNGDLIDTGGSPGDARQAITVANSMDGATVADGTSISIDGGAATEYASSRAVLYDWANPDLTGEVVAAPASNATACSRYTGADALALAGKVVLVKWTASALECGSVDRGLNLRNAGATGFILADSEETLGGIKGDTDIPGVLLVKSGSDAIRAALEAGKTVTVTGTAASSVTQIIDSNTNRLNPSSSRGIHEAGNVKPDVAAVGDTVFSAGNGTGNDGVSMSGTSMAAPTVAGLAALVRQAHPTWTPEQVKAAIVNTAGVSVTTLGPAGGQRYAPARVGAGRIVANAAVATNVVAKVVDDPGAVSVSFGPVEVSGPTELTKTVRVSNLGTSPVEYLTSYEGITMVAGTHFWVSPASITVPAGESRDVTVTFTASGRADLDNSVDRTVGRITPGGWARNTLAEASGLLLLTPSSGTVLRVPVYAAPRPVSDLSGGADLALDPVTNKGTVTLTGSGLGFGANGTLDGDSTNDINSIGAAFELTASDPAEPQCTAPGQSLCYNLPDEQAMDIRRVGVTTGEDYLYFAITSEKPWSTLSKAYFEVDLDTTGDGQTDYAAFTWRAAESDRFMAALVDVNRNKLLSRDPINGLWGNIDTQMYDSNTLILPVWLPALDDVDPTNSRIKYGVSAWIGNGPLDLVGLDPTTYALQMSVDAFKSGLSVTGPNGLPIYTENTGTVLHATKDAATYAANGSQGLMLVHLHNAVGAKSEVLSLRTAAVASQTTLTLNPATVEVAHPVTLEVAVTGAAAVPTGQVQVVEAESGEVVAQGALDGTGKANLTYTPGVSGTVRLLARYQGDAANQPSASTVAALTVNPTPPPPPSAARTSTKMSVDKRVVVRGGTTTAVVQVSAVGGSVPTGGVTLVDDGTGQVVASGQLANGKATLQFAPTVPKLMTLQARYTGNASFEASGSPFAPLQVVRATSATTLSLSRSTMPLGGTVTATVKIAKVNGIPATGLVRLTSNGHVVASGPLVNGTAKIPYKPQRKGMRIVVATYGGSTVNLPARSNAVRLTVN